MTFLLTYFKCHVKHRSVDTDAFAVPLMCTTPFAGAVPMNASQHLCLQRHKTC